MGHLSSESHSAEIAPPSTPVTCPLCGEPASVVFDTTDRNRGITSEHFVYARCDACRTYFLLNVPHDLSLYYPREYYSLPSPPDLARLALNERHKVALLTGAGLTSNRRLVEIGAGPGAFAYAARANGYAVTAVEMDERCCEYLASRVGVDVIESADPASALATLPRSGAIALWHVLEHLSDPLGVLDAVAANLGVGGVLAVATPNPEAFQFRLLRSRWAHVDAPRHLFLIPAQVLATQAELRGLHQVTITTNDPDGRAWNRFGWEYALRRSPARRAPSAPIRVGSKLLERALRPVENRGMRGAAYTAVFVKGDMADV